jgi:hypothetical protein
MMQKNEGCHVWGDIVVAKVAGHLQIAPGRAYEHQGRVIHDMHPLKNARIDISHSIDHLSFGTYYPGQVNSLHGTSFDQRATTKENPKQQAGACPLLWLALMSCCSSAWPAAVVPVQGLAHVAPSH